MNEKVYLIKPHHFLDYLYDLAINNRHENEVNVYGSNNGLLCRLFIDGELKNIKFTPFVDDICKPCKNIIDGKCMDTFDEVTTKYYGTNSKNEFNYNLDIKLNKALGNIFNFDKEQIVLDVCEALKESLTPEIIRYYLWNRENRVENTFIGIDKAISIYNK